MILDFVIRFGLLTFDPDFRSAQRACEIAIANHKWL